MRGEPCSNFASRRACDVAHDPGIPICAWHGLQPCPPPRAALGALPAFGTDLLSVAPLTLTCLTPLVDTPLVAFFNQFLTTHLQIIHLTLPNFIGVPPGPGEVCSTLDGHSPSYHARR